MTVGDTLRDPSVRPSRAATSRCVSTSPVPLPTTTARSRVAIPDCLEREPRRAQGQERRPAHEARLRLVDPEALGREVARVEPDQLALRAVLDRRRPAREGGGASLAQRRLDGRPVVAHVAGDAGAGHDHLARAIPHRCSCPLGVSTSWLGRTLILDGFSARPLPPLRWKFVTNTTVAIIGGGISGLSAAYALHKREVPYLLLEASAVARRGDPHRDPRRLPARGRARLASSPRSPRASPSAASSASASVSSRRTPTSARSTSSTGGSSTRCPRG